MLQVETAIVVGRVHDAATSCRLDSFLEEANVSVSPITASQARIARQAYRDFGKGSGHPAQLNFGDCFTYALATEFREPVFA
jgi:ribonuclease VapC